MKTFASVAIFLTLSASAVDMPPPVVGDHGHYELNSHFDNHDVNHQHYGSDSPASPAYPTAPNFKEAVGSFDSYGTLFGEHRYQL